MAVAPALTDEEREDFFVLTKCPILALKVTFATEEYARKARVELWRYPDNAMILELSTRLPPPRHFK